MGSSDVQSLILISKQGARGSEGSRALETKKNE